jgi:prepilin-type N-terminal cleavage/methylation domain-containing protein
MVKDRQQQGFTLLELLISLAIGLIAVTAAVLLMTKFARGTGAYAEASYLEEARGSSESLLRADMDGAGYNLTRPSAPIAGKQLVQFLSDPQYSSAPGTVQKLTDVSAEVFGSQAVSSGLSLWQWTPANICKYCSVEIYGSDGHYNFLSTYSDQFGTGIIYIWEWNAGYVASSAGYGVQIPAHVAGDTYQIGIEAPNQQQTSRFVRYYRIRAGIRTVLYTSTAPVPAAPNYISTSMNTAGSTINNFSVIGAPIANRANNQTEFARLPYIGGFRMDSPVMTDVSTNSTYILSGDKNTDASPALTTFSSNSTQIDLKTPSRGSYATGDTVLLIDYGNSDPVNPVSAATAACVVTAVSNPDSLTTRLTLTRARQTSPGIGGVWSSDTDHAHTFSPTTGTLVVKLAPPITYALSTDARLVRIEGSRASTIAFNARSLTVTQSGSNPARSVSVSVVLAAEGFETANTSTDETRATVQFTSTPRAMNLASNQLN